MIKARENIGEVKEIGEGRDKGRVGGGMVITAGREA